MACDRHSDVFTSCIPLSSQLPTTLSQSPASSFPDQALQMLFPLLRPCSICLLLYLESTDSSFEKTSLDVTSSVKACLTLPRRRWDSDSYVQVTPTSQPCKLDLLWACPECLASYVFWSCCCLLCLLLSQSWNSPTYGKALRALMTYYA